MALTPKKILAMANGYTDESIAGGGAIKGKNCTIKSKTAITGGTRITFSWYLDNGTEQETTMDVMDGADGKGIASVAVNEQSHLIITYTDGTTTDAGAIEVHSAVDSVNGKTGEVTLTASDVGALPDNTPIPSKTSDLTNDSNFVPDASYVHTDNNYTNADKAEVAKVADKVDKIAGKGLSANDYTNTDKAIVDGVTDAINAVKGEIQTSTLVAGNTTLTFTFTGLTSSSLIDVYADVYGIAPTNIAVSGTTLTLTFDEQQSDVSVKVHVH